ncbi:MAG: hypothetical protein AAB323_01990 [Pseudomonadota bacterium]
MSGSPGVTGSSVLRLEPVSTGVQEKGLDPGSAVLRTWSGKPVGYFRSYRQSHLLLCVAGQRTSTKPVKAACLSDAVPKLSDVVMDEGSFSAVRDANTRDEQHPSN